MPAKQLFLGAVLALSAAISGAAAQDISVPVILPLTGNAAFVGQEQQKMLELVAKSANASGGVQGRKLNFAFYDDQSTPQLSVQLAGQVLAAHPNIVLGSSITAMCNAMAPLMKNGPVMYCLSPGIHPVPGSYIFSTFVQTQQLNQALIRYFRLRGFTKIAMLSSLDATGQDADQGVAQVLALPENAGIKMVAHPHFNVTDVSVAAQIEQVRASGAEALIAWSTGSQIANIFKSIVQVGLDIPVATTSGNQQFQQLAQYKDFLPKELLIPCAYYPPHEGITKLDPRVEQVQQDMYAQLASAGLKPDNATGTSWDAGLITVAALRKLGPDATADQIRGYIAGLTDFPGIDGLYDFVRVPQRGVDVSSAIVTRYDPNIPAWTWVSSPGGTPLPH
jgi:branched-chain amino acid transport system substrate-binding protein